MKPLANIKARAANFWMNGDFAFKIKGLIDKVVRTRPRLREAHRAGTTFRRNLGRVLRIPYFA